MRGDKKDLNEEHQGKSEKQTKEIIIFSFIFIFCSSMYCYLHNVQFLLLDTKIFSFFTVFVVVDFFENYVTTATKKYPCEIPSHELTNKILEIRGLFFLKINFCNFVQNRFSYYHVANFFRSLQSFSRDILVLN
jgi:hypothetical protein